MHCPNCNSKKIEIDIHSDGYAKHIMECGSCGTLWLADDGQKIIHLRKKAA